MYKFLIKVLVIATGVLVANLIGDQIKQRDRLE